MIYNLYEESAVAAMSRLLGVGGTDSRMFNVKHSQPYGREPFAEKPEGQR